LHAVEVYVLNCPVGVRNRSGKGSGLRRNA